MRLALFRVSECRRAKDLETLTKLENIYHDNSLKIRHMSQVSRL